MHTENNPDGPTLVVDTEVLATHLTLDDRAEILRRYNPSLSLATLSKLIGKIDLSHLRSDPPTVEHEWLRGIPGELGRTLLRLFERGKHTLEMVSAVQCLKEMVEHCDPISTKAITRTDLATCLLGINKDIDGATTTSPTSWADLQDELTLQSIAQQSFHRVDMLQTLGAAADALWRRPWPEDTSKGLTADLPTSAGALFSEVTGVEQEDLFYLCLAVWQYCSTHQKAVFNEADLIELGVPQPAIDFMFHESCLSLDELRTQLIEERGGSSFTPWVRYTLQRYPVVALATNKFVVLRPQYFFVRFMGRPPYFDLLQRIPRAEKVRAKHFEGAFRHQFETIIRETLERIARRTRTGRRALITNTEMENAWNPNTGNEVSTCDFAYVEGAVCVLVDANYRAVMQAYAEGRGTSADFRDELKNRYRTKFEQLVDTVRHFYRTGWTKNGCRIDRDTLFVPLVLVPDDGLPNDELIELTLREVAVPLVADFEGKVLPPTVLRHTELMIAEGLVEHRAMSAANVIRNWRASGLDGTMLPVSFEHYVTKVLGEPTYLPSFQRAAADAHSLRMMRRFFRYQFKHLPAMTRERLVEEQLERMQAEA